MLNDPLSVIIIGALTNEGGEAHTWNRVSDDAGRTTYISNDSPFKLSISHNVSKENGTVVTDRVSVRVDITKVIDGVPATGQCTLVSSVPRRSDFALNTDMAGLLDTLYSILAFRAENGNAVADKTAFLRILRGEG